MKAIALGLLLMMATACASWYKTGHATIAGVYATTDVAWSQARGWLHKRALDEIDTCNDAGTPRDQCKGWQKIVGLRRDIATALVMLDAAMQEAYLALERAKENPSLESQAKQLVRRFVAMAEKVEGLMREHRLWHEQVLRPLDEIGE